MTTFAERVRFFEKRIAPKGDCWEWTGAKHFSSHGGGPYGRAQLGGRAIREQWYAHRLSWVIHHGEIPAGLTLDHLCPNTLCVNPAHLEPVPASVNSKRAGEKYRTNNPRCPQGHMDWATRPTGRYCAECNRTRSRLNKKENTK